MKLTSRVFCLLSVIALHGLSFTGAAKQRVAVGEGQWGVPLLLYLNTDSRNTTRLGVGYVDVYDSTLGLRGFRSPIYVRTPLRISHGNTSQLTGTMIAGKQCEG